MRGTEWQVRRRRLWDGHPPHTARRRRAASQSNLAFCTHRLRPIRVVPLPNASRAPPWPRPSPPTGE
jgi:hypothetical protein